MNVQVKVLVFPWGERANAAFPTILWLSQVAWSGSHSAAAAADAPLHRERDSVRAHVRERPQLSVVGANDLR